jgi:ATP-dependent helicase/nuclease subunit A
MEGARERAVTDFSCDIAVDASAGTGKTATLVARVTNLFLRDRTLSPDEVLLLTFTDKAAAEMKSRLGEGWELLLAACRTCVDPGEVRTAMSAWNPLFRLRASEYGTIDDLRSRAEEMADGAGRVSVTTFHSFCARVLLAFPAEARVDPRFKVLPESESSDAWDAAFRKFLRAEFGTEAIDPSWERVLSRSARPEAVWRMVRRLCLFHRDLLFSDGLDFGTSADFLVHLREEYGRPVEWFREFVAGVADPGHAAAQSLREALAGLEQAWAAVLRGDLVTARALASPGEAAMRFDANLTRSRKAFPLPPGGTPAAVRDKLCAFYRELEEVPPGDAAARFLFERSRAAARIYEEAKGSGLDFLDLLLRAKELFVNERSVAARLSRRFRYVFVDEFQDTDPLQAEMLRVLSADGVPGRLFLVGDPKQSIYGFRRADIQEYHRFRESIVARNGAVLTLERNFRSRPDLVASINGLFARVLEERGDFSPPYLPVVPERKDHGDGSPMTVFSLAQEVPEPQFLCGLIRKIVGCVQVGGKGGVPARQATFRDIAVLYRSDTGGEILASYRKAFFEAGIPHTVPMRKGFYARQEIQDLRMVLSAVDEPADPSARYAALKTIFFGLSDGEILPLFAHGEGEASRRVRDALSVLNRLSARRGMASLASLLEELYLESGVDFVAARLDEGERILQNLEKARGMARAFEGRGGGSAKAFLAEIRRRTEEDREETEFPPYDEWEDAVGVSTIHASKGREFPVVILANLSRGGGKRLEGLRVDRGRRLAAVIFPGLKTYSAYRRVDGGGAKIAFERWEREKQEAEERRLLYVAATRAKDRLFFVEGAGGRGSEIQKALHEGLSAARDGGEAGCSVTGLAGRLRIFESGRLDGISGSALLVAVAEPLRADLPRVVPGDRSVADLPDGPESREPLTPLPEPVPLKEFDDRLRGREFGEKVHRALEADPPVTSPWPRLLPAPPVDWGEGEEDRWEKIRARIVESRFHDLLRRTVPVGTELPLLSCRGGLAGEERADLVVRSEKEYWIVDYKTGGREEETEASYRSQVRRYVETLRAAWGAPVRGFIWYVETGEAFEVAG